MTVSSSLSRKMGAFPEREQRLQVLDVDLDIMEQHAGELAEMESTIREDMRRWDREFKNERLHSIPRPRKHMR